MGSFSIDCVYVQQSSAIQKIDENHFFRKKRKIR